MTSTTTTSSTTSSTSIVIPEPPMYNPRIPSPSTVRPTSQRTDVHRHSYPPTSIPSYRHESIIEMQPLPNVLRSDEPSLHDQSHNTNDIPYHHHNHYNNEDPDVGAGTGLNGDNASSITNPPPYTPSSDIDPPPLYVEFIQEKDPVIPKKIEWLRFTCLSIITFDAVNIEKFLLFMVK